jgi:hypothetical protein
LIQVKLQRGLDRPAAPGGRENLDGRERTLPAKIFVERLGRSLKHECVLKRRLTATFQARFRGMLNVYF